MRRFNTVVKFSTHENSKKLVEFMEDYARHDLNDRMNTKFSVDSSKTKEEKARKINEVYFAEIQRRSGQTLDNFDGDVVAFSNSTAVAEMQAQINKILLDAVTPIVINATNLNMLAEIHYGGYGDTFEYKMVDDTLYDVSKMGRRQRNTKTQERKKQNKTIGMDMYGLSTVSNLPKIILNEDMIAEDMMLMGLSVNQKIYSLIVKAFVEATDQIEDTRFKVTNYTEKTFLEKLRNGSAYNGSPMKIIGDAVALKDLVPENTSTRILLQDAYNTTLGYMDTWNGYEVAKFEVTRDDKEKDGILGLPTNKFYGISTGTNGKLIHVGIGSTRATTDNPEDRSDFSKVTTIAKELGVALATNQKVVVCDIQGE